MVDIEEVEYTMREKIIEAMKDAEKKAWEALSGYKFIMFGYHASRWVSYNKLLDKKYSNPFSDLVLAARVSKMRR